ncbi:MAG TPA: hypothetical protein VJO33_20495 [Gemmatimonadaceae bacterium]|nr:hypothetical protein [Gemmatimonadaceae bacterium]
MESSPAAVNFGLAQIVEEYRATGNIGTVFDRVRTLANQVDPDQLAQAAQPYHDMPEVVIPAYEHIVAAQPQNAQAMVLLANAYWLTGRGADVVGALAARAKAVDGSNRGAWHLWALAEPALRARVERWRKVSQQFPSDQLARAALADNATSLADAEDDPAALDLAIQTYESLLTEANTREQVSALTATLRALKGKA